MKFVPIRGSRITGPHKDKKQRVAEALSDLQLLLAGIASRGDGFQDGTELAQIIASLARTGSVFLRKLVLGEPGNRGARLLDDSVLASLKLRLQPLRKIPKDRRRTVETGYRLDRVLMAVTRLDESTGQPVERYKAVGGRQGLSIAVEWPLPGMADWVEAPLETVQWQMSSEQLFDTNSDRSMRCDDWLGQQVVMFDRKGVTLEKLIRTVANFDGAHAVNVGRLATIDGEVPSTAAKDPDIHILRNITFFGVGYADLVVVETALYLYRQLLDDPSIEQPRGGIWLVTPTFECPPSQTTSARPPWLGFKGGMMASFSPTPGIVRHTVRGVA